jgi:hypothetical protein
MVIERVFNPLKKRIRVSYNKIHYVFYRLLQNKNIKMTRKLNYFIH